MKPCVVEACIVFSNGRLQPMIAWKNYSCLNSLFISNETAYSKTLQNYLIKFKASKIPFYYSPIDRLPTTWTPAPHTQPKPMNNTHVFFCALFGIHIGSTTHTPSGIWPHALWYIIRYCIRYYCELGEGGHLSEYFISVCLNCICRAHTCWALDDMSVWFVCAFVEIPNGAPNWGWYIRWCETNEKHWHSTIKLYCWDDVDFKWSYICSKTDVKQYI